MIERGFKLLGSKLHICFAERWGKGGGVCGVRERGRMQHYCCHISNDLNSEICLIADDTYQ